MTLSAVCLWVAFRRVEVADLATSLRTADYRWLLFYPVLATALNLVRSEIWRLLLRKRVTVADAFWAYGTGFLVNNVLPLRMGEAARIGLLATRRRLPLAEVAAAAGLERGLDLMFVLLILTWTLPFAGGAHALRRGVAMVGATTALGAAALVIVIAFGAQVERGVSRVLALVAPRHADPALRRWRELAAGVSVVRYPGVALPALAGSLVVWTITIALQWTVLRAFQPLASVRQAALVVGVVSLVGAVPSAPGAIGTYQWVGQQALALPFPALYTPAGALTIAVVSHATSYVFSSTLGACGLWYFGVPLARFTRIRQRDPGLELARPPFEPSPAAKK